MVDVHNSKGPNYNLNRLGAKYFRRQIDKKMFEDIVSGLVNRAEEQHGVELTCSLWGESFTFSPAS